MIHKRLSIIDLNNQASQPMVDNSDRYVIVFNGEVYNYIELRNEIGAKNFRTNSDTEVILKSFIKWGENCVNHLRGMFSFVIWDKKHQTFFIARDRFGIKPLYWLKNNDGFYFASEIKSLVPFLEKKEINNQALSDYLTYQFTVLNKTFLKDIHEFPAANHSFFSSKVHLNPKRYWNVDFNSIDFEHSENWFIEKLESLIDESINLHGRADVDIGSYVSGGIDSSLVASSTKNVNQQDNFHIFNGRFTDSGNFDESHYAKALADQGGMTLHITDITEKDFVDNIQNIIWHMDQPTAGPGSFAQYMVSKEASKYLKVVLGGQGGDEIFGGYTRYLIAYFEKCIKGAIDGTLNNGDFIVTYQSIIPNLQHIKSYVPMLKEFWSNGLFSESHKRYFNLINRGKNYGSLIAPDVIDFQNIEQEFDKIYFAANVDKESYFDSMSHFDFKTLLPALLHVEDRMSMANGLESRVPLLDHPLIEFSATIPSSIKFKNGELKRMLKLIANKRIPKSILDRKDKMGFPVPINSWIKNGGVVRDFIFDTLSTNKAKSRDYLAKPFSVDNLVNSEATFGRNLWALLNLEIWQTQFIDA